MGKFLLIRLSLVTQDMIYPPIRRKQVQTSRIETFEIDSKVPTVTRDRGSSRRSADRCGAQPGDAAHPNHKALTPAGARAAEAALGLGASSRRGIRAKPSTESPANPDNRRVLQQTLEIKLHAGPRRARSARIVPEAPRPGPFSRNFDSLLAVKIP